MTLAFLRGGGTRGVPPSSKRTESRSTRRPRPRTASNNENQSKKPNDHAKPPPHRCDRPGPRRPHGHLHRARLAPVRADVRRSARWGSALKSWYGGGESCPHCADDPCGSHGYHGNWEGLECRGDWIVEDGWSRWSGQKSAKGPCKKITNFPLPDRGLEGPFPEHLKYFPNLHEIDIDSNAMVGPLPEWLACMSNLIEIDLEENDFTGTIPRAWGNLRQLEEVEDDPQLHGCIPQDLPANEHGGHVSFSTDPKIGTSWGGTRINGKRCPTAPMPDCAHTKIPEDAHTKLRPHQ